MENCKLCGYKSALVCEGQHLCKPCYQAVNEIVTADRATGERVNVAGVVRRLFKQNTQSRLLKVYDVPGDLLDNLKSLAASEGITLRELVIRLFNEYLETVR